MRNRFLALLTLVLAASALVVTGSRGGPAKPFPHGKHIEAGLECDHCHAAAESENMTAGLLPKVEVCKECHEAPELQTFGYAEMPKHESGFHRFPHKAHLTAEMNGETCHGALFHADWAAQGKGEIGHDLCWNCHDGVKQKNDCEMCHTNLREGRNNAMVRDPSIMKPMDHHPGFLHDHSFASRLDGVRCAQCHRQEDFCSSCHQGENVDFLTHERNWLQTHPVAARKNLNDCAACHDVGVFCTECHASQGVRPGSHAQAGWVETLHAQAAHRDITYCASCHDGENEFVCAHCHKDTGGRGDQPNMNIHPSDFRSSIEHGYWHDDRDAACFQCHDQGARKPGVGFCGYCHGVK